MPFLHILISGARDAALAEAVAQRAVDITARLLGKQPEHTAVAVDFVDASLWFIAGRALRESRARSFHWSVSITDETNTKAEKAAYLDAVHGTMQELLGEVAEPAYVHLADLRASAYGFGGRTQEYRHQHAA